MSLKIGVIKGDGIGPEIVAEAKKVLDRVCEKYSHKFSYTEVLLGGASIDAHGVPLTEEAIAQAKASDAVLMGSIGGDAKTSPWYKLEPSKRPEAGLLAIRKALNLFANLRPAYLYNELRDACPLRDEIIGDGFDMIIVRELTGGLYFGARKTTEENGVRTAVDTLSYNENEIRRIAIKAFEIARKRRNKVTSVDKANVLDSSRLWRSVVEDVAKDYPDVTLEHMLVDNCASGGRRIDLESISRSAPMWRTDYSYGEPIGYQCHTYGLNLYLPLHGTGTVSADKFTFRSSLGTSIIYNWKITEAGQSIYDMRDRQAEFKELRPYFYEDYYPLSGINNITSENIWLAYQLYRPSDDSGYIVAFRRKDNPDKSYTVNLSGLHPDHTYILTNKDTGEAIKKTGKELANGFTLTLDNPQSCLIIKYQSSTTAIQKLSVGKKTGVKLRAIGAELDPHFLSQNVTRNDGAKAEDWDRIVVKRVKEMGLQSLRVMVMPQWYEPKNDNPDASKIDWHNFTFNSVEMQSLYKVLDMAQEQKMEVTLVLWGAPPGHFLAEGNYGNWVVAPTNYEEWSENFSALVQHLLNNKKYTCVKEITPINEPDWSYIIKGKAAPTADYIEMCKVLDRRFKEDGIRNKVHFSLSDNSDGGTGTHKYLAACTKGLANVADVFNSHTYIFGYETPNSTILDWEKQNSQLASSVGKAHFIGEFGGNQCVGATRQKDIDLYERGVLMTRIAINLLNAGASGVSYWSLIDQYYGKDADYGAMQQLGLWKYVKKTYASEPYYNDIKSDYEVRPQYYAYSLLTRFIRPGAEIYPIATPEEWYAGTAVRNTNGKWVYVFANGMDQEKAISLINQHTQTKGNYQVYRYIKDGLPTTDQMLAPDAQPLKVNDKILCLLPAHSVIVLKQE